MNQSEEKYREQIRNGILEHELDSWWAFCNFVKDENRCWPTLIYRGQANAKWKVESTLDRLEKRFPTTPNLGGGVPIAFDVPRVPREVQLLRFKELARGSLKLNAPHEKDENEWWALAQHHGLATPMLDWTYSPFVALFFAFEEKKCDCDGEYRIPEHRAVFAVAHHLLQEGKNGEPPRPLSPKGHANYRLMNQGALFLKMPPSRDLESWVKDNFSHETYKKPVSKDKGSLHPRAILEKFIIPNKDREQCLRFLDYMNINRASLFPDLDGTAQYVNDLWEVNFDKAIGHINTE